MTAVEPLELPMTVMCLHCQGEARQRVVETLRETVGAVYRCGRCGHRQAAFLAGPNDPPETLKFIRCKIARLCLKHPDLVKTLEVL